MTTVGSTTTIPLVSHILPRVSTPFWALHGCALACPSANFLEYGTGGYAFANADVEARNERRFGNENDFRAFGSESENLHGYIIGAGAEASVTKRLSVGLEYRYTDFENTDIVGRFLIWSSRR